MLTKWSLIWDCKTGYSKKYFYEEQPQVPKEFTGGLDKLSVIILQKIGKPFIISNFYPFITGIWYSECHKSATIA